MWTLYEPIHAISYFAAEARAEFEQAGLRGFWRGYFAGRAAPLGAIGPAPVVGLFNTFAPSMVERALPAVWDLVSPAEALAARSRGAACRARRRGRCPGSVPRSPTCSRRSWRRTNQPVTLLGAANLALPEPDDPHARLWQACTSLREHRGDGHVAALVAVGATGADIVVLRCGIGWDRAVHQPARGWSDEDWLAATVQARSPGATQTPMAKPPKPAERSWPRPRRSRTRRRRRRGRCSLPERYREVRAQSEHARPRLPGAFSRGHTDRRPSALGRRERPRVPRSVNQADWRLPLVARHSSARLVVAQLR